MECVPILPILIAGHWLDLHRAHPRTHFHALRQRHTTQHGDACDGVVLAANTCTVPRQEEEQS